MLNFQFWLCYDHMYSCNCSWTVIDMTTACRQMGFEGGRWRAWLDRQPGHPVPRLLLEEPRCTGNEDQLQQCSNWGGRQMGSGVCGKLIFQITK
jgi:hypothetical protein